ncbi:MAG: hypothetical protein ABGY71_13390 [bacterium]|jgi:hypothetical protein|nr:hypothetical protein [Planctomycetota bacterium]HIL51095.1 hypothetical protein [Planctomycetota bacterium]
MNTLQLVTCGACAVSLLAFAPGAGLLAQDTIAPGFSQTSSEVLPAAFASYATLATGERVIFDGLSIDLYDGAGVFMLNLASLPSFVFNSFVAIDPGLTFAICGETSNHDIFKVALDGSGYSTLCNLPFNYDAVFENSGSLIVSAAVCGFGCGNDILRVDTTSGQVTSLAQVAGSSGPLALDAGGGLFYATNSGDFPAPPGSTSILRWSNAQLQSGSVLVEADAAVFHAGLDGAASMAVDPGFGNLFLAESIFGSASRILEFDKQSGSLADVVVESPSWLAALEFGDKGGNGHMHAYQPATGTFLRYLGANIVTVEPLRPTTSVNYNGNQVTFSISGAKPNSAVLVLWGPAATHSSPENSYQLGFDFEFHTGIPLGQIRRTPWYTPTDANGAAQFTYFDFQNLAGTLVFQGLITDETGAFIGSCEAAFN